MMTPGERRREVIATCEVIENAITRCRTIARCLIRHSARARGVLLKVAPRFAVAFETPVPSRLQHAARFQPNVSSKLASAPNYAIPYNEAIQSLLTALSPP